MRPLAIDPQSALPAYRQVANGLRDQIRGGALRPGQQLPSENELMASLGLARMTVRNALQVLREEGLVEARHGRGVFVRSAPPILRVNSKRFRKAAREATKGAFAAEVASVGRVGRQEVRAIEAVEAPAEVAERLGLRKGSKVVVRRRAMYADDVPMQLADSYYPASLVRGTAIMQEDTGPGGSYSRLEELGHAPVRCVEELQARMPTPEERSLLNLGLGVPVVKLIRVAYDAGGKAVEVFDSVAAGDKHIFVYEFPLD